jgi:hypothetical protein
LKLTNKFNLPESFVNSVSYDKYINNDTFSYSSLSEPPQITQLSIRHDSEIEDDVSNRVWLLFGSAIHNYLQYHAGNNEIVEKRLFAEIDGYKISGQQDLLIDGIIHDWKTTTVKGILFNPKGQKEWITQLNIYAWLARRNGYEIKGLQINAILRDWKSDEIGFNYPKIPIKTFPIEMWPESKTEEYIKERISIHIISRELTDDKLPECSDEEMWHSSKKPFYYPRCNSYCLVSKWCHQVKRRNLKNA